MLWFLYFMGFASAFSLTLAAFAVLYGRAQVRERLLVISQLDGELEKDKLELPFYNRVIEPIYENIAQKMESITPKRMKQDMEKTIQYAGKPWNLNANKLMLLQLVSFVGAFGLGWGFVSLSGTFGGGGGSFFLAIASGLVGLFLPLIIINTKASSRQGQIQKDLPNFLDMLYVSVEAGLGFDMALKKISTQMSGELSKEFGRTLEEIKIGRNREEALRKVIKRTGVQDLSIFVSSVIQTEQLGSNIGNTLRIQADSMRIKRKQRAEEKAMKAPVKMLFPIVFFIFPALFVVILGPAVIRIMDTLVDIL